MVFVFSATARLLDARAFSRRADISAVPASVDI